MIQSPYLNDLEKIAMEEGEAVARISANYTLRQGMIQ
jgi:hypothetical protein